MVTLWDRKGGEGKGEKRKEKTEGRRIDPNPPHAPLGLGLRAKRALFLGSQMNCLVSL